MSNIEKAKPAGVPALANTPAVDIDSSDIQLPRIRIAQDLTTAVQDDLVKKGVIFASVGSDDPEPQVLEDGSGEGVLIHVLGIRKGKSLNIDGQLETWAFNDPDAHPDARTTYDYTVCLPEVDEDVPYRWLFTGSSTPAARLINTVVAKNQSRGPVHQLAFRVNVKQKTKDLGGKSIKYFAATARQVEAAADHVEASGALAALVASMPQPSDVEASTGTGPAI